MHADQNNAPKLGSKSLGASPASKLALRRRLVQGSLSAPLVMTVTAAAGAGRTSFTACLDNARTTPRPHRVLARHHHGADDWLRVQVEVYEVSLPTGDGGMVKQSGKYFIGPDKVTMFQLAEHQSESIPAKPVHKFNAHTLGVNRQLVEKRYALAFADKQGKIIGFGWQDNGGIHCKKSCFSSVVARVADRRRRA
jgi:hypothetical protein